MPHFVYLQAIFFISEVALLLSRRSKKSTAKTNADKRSLLILWIVIGGTLGFGPWLASYAIWPVDPAIADACGVSICLIGFIIRWIAILQLGKMFTVDVAINTSHVLKTTGLYHLVRHPSYLGLILIIAGLAVCMGSVLAFLVIFIPTFLALNFRMQVEEDALIQEFGDQYIQYKSKVKRIIPGVY